MPYRDTPLTTASGQRISIPRFGTGSRAMAALSGGAIVCALLALAASSMATLSLTCHPSSEPGSASCAVAEGGLAWLGREPATGARTQRNFTFAHVDRRLGQANGRTFPYDVLVLDHNGSDRLDIADIGTRGWRSRGLASEFNDYVSSGATSARRWPLREPSYVTAIALSAFALVVAVFATLFFRGIRVSFDARERAVVIVTSHFPKARRWTARIGDIVRAERVDREDDKGEVCSVRIVTSTGDPFDLGLQWRNPDRVDEVVTRIATLLKAWHDSDRAFVVDRS